MRPFLTSVAIATVLGMFSASKADAQIVYGYTVPSTNGVVTNRLAYGPGGYQQTSSFFNPFTGIVQGQTYGSNVFGQTYSRSYGYSPFTGLGYQSGFYQPGFYQPNRYISPYGAYNYRFLGRRWW